MRFSPGFARLLGLAAIACGGASGPSDLFTDGGKSSTAAGGSAAGGAANGLGGLSTGTGGVSPAGGVSSGGAADGLGGAAPASGGTNTAGSTSSNGGAPSSSGGREPSAGADSRGGSSATGGAGTAGASSGGAPNSNGGTTSASGGSGSGGKASGGTGSVVDCAMLRSRLSTLLTAAQECDRTTSVDQCTGTVETECGCRVPINNPDSADTKAYNNALTQLKKQCPNVVCTAALCANPQGAVCANSGSSGPHCVGTNLASGNGPGGFGAP